jgi:hypothetical protein
MIHRLVVCADLVVGYVGRLGALMLARGWRTRTDKIKSSLEKQRGSRNEFREHFVIYASK